METYLLLSHLENDMYCPLCSLSGVSYNELCLHISSAHPENQHTGLGVVHFASSSGYSCGTNTGVIDGKNTQTSKSCLARDSCDTDGEATPTSASCITRELVQPKKNSTLESEYSSTGETKPITLTLTTWSPETRQEPARHCNEEKNGFKSEHNKQKWLSSPRKGH